MTASVAVAGDGGVPRSEGEKRLEAVAWVEATRAIPKRQPWGGPDWPQRSGYEIRAEAERQTARVIRDVLREECTDSTEDGET